MLRRFAVASLLVLLAASTVPAVVRAGGNQAICYNCPPEWADWASELKAIDTTTGVQIPPDNKNSGQSLSQLIAEKSNPVADMVYYGVTFGIAAKAQDVIAPYKPAHFNDIPAGLKDPDGYWFTIHSGTLGFFVNVGALRWQARAQVVERSAQTRLQGHGRLSGSLERGRRLRRCGRGERRARRHAR